MNKKADNLKLGLFLGIAIPILSILLVYLIYFRYDYNVWEFFKTLFALKIYTKVMAVAVYFGNIVTFFFFIKKDKLQSARGVLMATIIYSFIILALRLSI